MFRTQFSRIELQDLAVKLLNNRLSYQKRNVFILQPDLMHKSGSSLVLIYQIAIWSIDVINPYIFTHRLSNVLPDSLLPDRVRRLFTRIELAKTYVSSTGQEKLPTLYLELMRKPVPRNLINLQNVASFPYEMTYAHCGSEFWTIDNNNRVLSYPYLFFIEKTTTDYS